MKLRRKHLFILPVVALLFLGAIFSLTGGIRISVGPDTLQAELDSRLPFDRSIGPLRYGVSSAIVSLLPDGRVRIDAMVDGSVEGRHATGEIVASSPIRYVDGGFYLSDLKIERDDVRFERAQTEDAENAATRFGARIAALGKAVSGGEVANAARSGASRMAEASLSGLLAVRPVYTLRATDLKHSVARLTLRDVRVQDGHLVLVLDPFGAVVRVLIEVVAFGLAAVFILVALGFLA